nr:hypothetical protein [Tanacetum cinerariifolium]
MLGLSETPAHVREVRQQMMVGESVIFFLGCKGESTCCFLQKSPLRPLISLKCGEPGFKLDLLPSLIDECDEGFLRWKMEKALPRTMAQLKLMVPHDYENC